MASLQAALLRFVAMGIIPSKKNEPTWTAGVHSEMTRPAPIPDTPEAVLYDRVLCGELISGKSHPWTSTQLLFHNDTDHHGGCRVRGGAFTPSARFIPLPRLLTLRPFN